MRKKKMSFTLIELLVVIAIIAILAGMLLPALSKVRGKGKEATCFGHIKNLSLAMATYVDDNKGYYPYGEWEWGADPNKSGWIQVLYLYKYLPTPKWGTGTSYHVHLDHAKMSVWTCAETYKTSTTYPLIAAISTHDQPGFWGLIRAAAQEKGATPRMQQKVKKPHAVAFFTCVSPGSGTITVRNRMYAYGSPSNSTRLLRGEFTRHPGNRGNYSFVDGHVESRTLKEIDSNHRDMFWADFKEN